MDAYSKEFRRDVLAACDAGTGTREVALRFGLSDASSPRMKTRASRQGKVAPKTTRNRRGVGAARSLAIGQVGPSGPTSISVSCRSAGRTRLGGLGHDAQPSVSGAAANAKKKTRVAFEHTAKTS